MNIWNRLTTGFDLTAYLLYSLYQKLISRNAGRGQIQAAFTQAVPVPVDEYKCNMR